MAMELLTSEYWGGKKTPFYRHDLEGLILILPWVFLQYNGSKLEKPTLCHWATNDYGSVRHEKTKLLEHLHTCKPMKSWKAEWRLARMLLVWLGEEAGERLARYSSYLLKQVSKRRWSGGEMSDDEDDDDDEASKVGVPGLEISSEDFYSHFCDQLKKIAKFHPPILPLLRVLSPNP